MLLVEIMNRILGETIGEVDQLLLYILSLIYPFSYLSFPFSYSTSTLHFPILLPTTHIEIHIEFPYVNTSEITIKNPRRVFNTTRSNQTNGNETDKHLKDGTKTLLGIETGINTNDFVNN